MLELGDVLRGLASKNEPACLAIVVQSGRGPVRAGAKAVFDARGERRGGDAVFSRELERQLGQRAAEALAAGEPGLVDLADESCGATLKVYLEPQLGHELVVLGRGPVAQAVARLAEAAGFHVRAVADGFAGLAPPGANANVVVATGHEADEEALAAALRGEPATVQLVASSRRAPLVLATLRKSGVPEAKLALVRSPAGLDLGGDAPEEIALSILAEIVALRRGGSGRPLSEVKGSRATSVPTVRLDAASVSSAPASAPAAVPAPATPNMAPARKHKVKHAMEDSDEFKIPTRHDEDFRPDEPEKTEKPSKSDRATRRSKKKAQPVEDDDDFRPSRSEEEDEESFR